MTKQPGIQYAGTSPQKERLAQVQEAIKSGELLPVMETFQTLQGEGFNTGSAAWFIRLAGCNVGCVWCDVKESWNASLHKLESAHNLAAEAAKHKGYLVVVTGGEPMMYNLQTLTLYLKENGCRIALETSGAHPLSGTWNWICFSPKKFKPALPEWYQVANELKVVIYNRHDFLWAEEHRKKMNGDALCYLQPEWDKREELLPIIIDYILKNPAWKLSLQTHKHLNIP
jgi:organic radical activating enzyme